MKTCVTLGIVLALIFFARAQVPKRLQIPGAIPIGSVGIDRPLPLRRLVQQQPLSAGPGPRLRRPIPNAISAPIPAIRPVVEEQEDAIPVSSLNLNEEAARLSHIPVASSTPRQQQILEDDDDDEPVLKPYIPPVQFRPERPPIQVAQPVRALPPQPIRQVQPVRQAPARQISQAPRRPQPQYVDDEEPRRSRPRKPEVKILRKYREDNPDGSITWGFENDDGTFKEETIGVDCITRGKYGYVDPDGNRREYTYETGLKCEQQEPELPEEPLIQPQGKLLKRPPPQQVRYQ